MDACTTRCTTSGGATPLDEPRDERPGDLSGSCVYAVERIDRSDRDRERRELLFASVARGLGPELVWHRSGLSARRVAASVSASAAR
jgi:hypothetical protein